MTVMFDFDEVFVDINPPALEYINEKLGTSYTLEDITAWDFFNQPQIKPHFSDFLGVSDIYQTKAHLNHDMINVCKQLMDMGEDVYIVTASLEHSHASKLQCIKDNMPFMPLDRVYVVNNSSKYKHKSDVLDDLPLNYREPIVLVDDGIHNILDMMADIRHKDTLNRTMHQFYKDRTLSKFNNKYHDFVYGIIPELSYNRELDDGKRIFKIKHPREIWNVLSHIKNTHDYRVNSKQYEIFDYLNNLIELNTDRSSYASRLSHNFEYLMHYCWARKNKQTDFIKELGKLLICFDIGKVDDVKINDTLNKVGTLFNSALFNDIKDLVEIHSRALEHNGDAEVLKAHDIFNGSGSTLKELLYLNKLHVDIVSKAIDSLDDPNVKNIVNNLLFNPYSGINNIDCLGDKNYIRANLLMILNKNIDIENGVVSVIHQDIHNLCGLLSEALPAKDYDSGITPD